MRTTLIVQEGRQQIVLTPECKHEKAILELIAENKVETTLKVGKFCDCQGGWINYQAPCYDFRGETKMDSLMIVLESKPEHTA